MSIDKDDLDRLGEALVSGEADTAPGAGPVDPAIVWDAVEGELDPEDVARLAERAARDPDLAAAWRLAVEVRRARGAGTRDTTVPASRTLWRRRALQLAAAAALVVAVAFPVLKRHLGGEATRYRGQAVSPVTPLPALPPRSPEELLVLRWRSTIPAAAYDVVISDENLHVIAMGHHLKRPEYHVPRQDLPALPAGTAILWQVVVVTPDGRRLTSPTFIAHVPASQPRGP